MPRDDHIDKPYLPNRKDFHLEKGTVMKSLMKKVFAAAAAIATVFGLAATTVATANAAGGNATLTVSTKDAKFAGKTVNAYKMFSATVSSDGGAVSHTLNDAWKPFFKDPAASGLTDNGVTDANVNDKANDYVSGLKNNTSALAAFAAKHRTGRRPRPTTSRLTRPLRYLRMLPRTVSTLRRSLVSTTATTWSLCRVLPWPTPTVNTPR